MCYSIIYSVQWNKLKSLFNIEIESEILDQQGSRVFPRKKSRVIVKSKKEAEYALPEMEYSLVPSWSKEHIVKWSSYNARLNRINPKTNSEEKIFEAPTWREPFAKYHCIVPMTKFFESCRERGIAKGHEVSFFEKNKDEIMFGAGIYSIWKGKIKEQEKTIFSFAIITTEPNYFIESVGHDRMPVFLQPDNCKKWMKNDFSNSEEAYQFLTDSKFEPDLDFEKVRELKS